MKNCNNFNELFIAEYIDNKLSLSDKKTFENHLNTCPSCIDTVITTKKTEKLFQIINPKPIPEELLEKVKGKTVIYNEKPSLSELIIELKDNIIKTLKDTFSTQEAAIEQIAFRSDNNIQSITSYKSNDFVLKIVPLDNKRVNLDLKLLRECFSEDTNISIFSIRDETKRMLYSKKTENLAVTLSEVEIGKYLIAVEDKNFVFDLRG